MKIRSKIYIHPLYYLVAFISFFIGRFKLFIIYTIIILVHELGHIFAGIILKWPIDKVIVYPFGCMTKFNNKLNSSIYEEFLILVYGPLFQILFNMLYKTPYHNFILLFNLLPIYPLDGSKLLFLVLNKLVSYYYSYIIIYVISFITIFIIIVTNHDLISVLIFSYIIYDLIRYINCLDSIMFKFYYERYKMDIKYNKIKIINGNKLKKIYKERINYFKIGDKYYSECIILRKTFDK